LYIHIPWCLKKCPYCDFNSHAVKDALPEKHYVDCLLADLARDIARYEITRPLETIFIGGGTPSLFSARALDDLLRGIQTQLTFAENIEITLEANPGTFEFEKFADFRAIGINRLSIGVQTFDDHLLSQLGRVHSGKEAIRAAEMAHNVGFENFNLDFMFGLPQSNLTHSKRDILTAMALEPTHLSFYQLTLEPNTYFHRYPPTLPSDDIIFQTQQHCQQILAAHHFEQYEVSAYSLRGKQCRHNVNYWQFGDYLGIGAGAHSKLSYHDKICREVRAKHPKAYMEKSLACQAVEREWLIEKDELGFEFMMNALRLIDGVPLNLFQARSGLSLDSLSVAIKKAQDKGLLLVENQTLKPTLLGQRFLNDLLELFLN
jgi:oxygen-independent coproporphyrinogen-3 oxidase